MNRIANGFLGTLCLWALSAVFAVAGCSDPDERPDDSGMPSDPDGSSDGAEPDADAGPDPVDGGDLGDAADAGDPWVLVDDPFAPLPELLSEVGFFEDMDHGRPLARAVEYAPQFPLWSNGSEKQRWLVLPDSEPIGNADEPADGAGALPIWEFPPGTMIFKSFTYPAPGGDSEEGELVPFETRLMRLGSEGEWDFAAYIWNEARTEAVRGDDFAATPLAVELEGERFEHTVPSGLECRTCHEAAEQRVLGFNLLQLDVGDQLAELDTAGVFDRSPPPPPSLEADSAQAREVLGYFVGNCVHCHNGWEDAPEPLFSLAPDVAFANLIGQATTRHAAAGAVRVVAGDPEQSVLYQVLSGETEADELELMPPLGVDRRDLAAVELVRLWIASLEAE